MVAKLSQIRFRLVWYLRVRAHWISRRLTSTIVDLSIGRLPATEPRNLQAEFCFITSGGLGGLARLFGSSLCSFVIVHFIASVLLSEVVFGGGCEYAEPDSPSVQCSTETAAAVRAVASRSLEVTWRIGVHFGFAT